MVADVKTYNHDHNILRLFDVLSNFHLTTTETSAIIDNKHGIYELLYRLANNLKIRILGNKGCQKNLKISKNYSLVLDVSPKMKIMTILAKTF